MPDPAATPEPAPEKAPIAAEPPAKPEGGDYLDDPSPTPPPEGKRLSIENNELVLSAPITFEPGGTRIRKESLPALEEIAGYLVAKDYITTMRIEGHVAEGGEKEKAQALSEARALAVSRWLVKRGIDCTRLLAVGLGWNKPIADGSTPEGKAKNERITAVNAELRGRAIGGMPIEGQGKVAGEVCPK